MPGTRDYKCLKGKKATEVFDTTSDNGHDYKVCYLYNTIIAEIDWTAETVRYTCGGHKIMTTARRQREFAGAVGGLPMPPSLAEWRKTPKDSVTYRISDGKEI